MDLKELMQQNYERNSSNKFYSVGEVLELIVYDKTYPSITEVKETIKTYTDTSREEMINHKMLGITYKVAVINRNINLLNGDKEKVDYDNLKLPVVTYITSYNPRMILNKSYGVKTLYVGLDLNSSPNSPKTTYLLPSLRIQNKLSKEAWYKIIKAYENSTEEETIQYFHNTLLQKQYCIVNVKDNKFVPVEIDIGTTFISKVYSVKDRFFNISSIEWDKETKRSKVISLFNSKLNEKTVEFAKLIKSKLDNRRNYVSKKETIELPDNDYIIDEDDPF